MEGSSPTWEGNSEVVRDGVGGATLLHGGYTCFSLMPYQEPDCWAKLAKDVSREPRIKLSRS